MALRSLRSTAPRSPAARLLIRNFARSRRRRGWRSHRRHRRCVWQRHQVCRRHPAAAAAGGVAHSAPFSKERIGFLFI